MHTGAHICANLCEGGGADLVGELDMHACTDACMPCDQGMGLVVG